jgi:hypothetical protein
MANHPGINGKGTRPAAPPIGVVDMVLFEGKRSTSLFSIRNGDSGDDHALFSLNVKIILTLPPRSYTNQFGNLAEVSAKADNRVDLASIDWNSAESRSIERGIGPGRPSRTSSQPFAGLVIAE